MFSLGAMGIGALIGARINTKEEWIELFYMVMAQSNEIGQISSSAVKQMFLHIIVFIYPPTLSERSSVLESFWPI